MDVFVEKVLPAGDQAAPALEGRDPLKWGSALESVIVAEWARQRGVRAWTPAQRDEVGELRPLTVRHPEHVIVLATPDAVGRPADAPMYVGLSDEVEAQIGCEAKAPGERQLPDFGAEPPDYYVVQCQWQMGVFDIDEWDLCALIGGQTFLKYRIHRDREIFGMLVDIAQKFWRDHVETKTAPEIDGSEASAEYIRRRWPKGNQVVREATVDEVKLLREFAGYREAIDSNKAELELVRQQILAAIGEAKGIEALGAKARIADVKPQLMPETDWQAVALALASGKRIPQTLIDSHTREVPKKKGYRRLTIKVDGFNDKDDE